MTTNGPLQNFSNLTVWFKFDVACGQGVFCLCLCELCACVFCLIVYFVLFACVYFVCLCICFVVKVCFVRAFVCFCGGKDDVAVWCVPVSCVTLCVFYLWCDSQGMLCLHVYV